MFLLEWMFLFLMLTVNDGLIPGFRYSGHAALHGHSRQTTNSGHTSNFGIPTNSAHTSNFGIPTNSAHTSNFGIPTNSAHTSNFGIPKNSAHTSNFGIPKDSSNSRQTQHSGQTPDSGHSPSSRHMSHPGHTPRPEDTPRPGHIPPSEDIESYVKESFSPSGIVLCRMKCSARGWCGSCGFDMVTLSCVMLTLAISGSEVRGTLTLIPKHLIQDSSDSCSQKRCRADFNCLTGYGGISRCVRAFVKVCGVPPEIYGTSVTYEGQYTDARANYTCATDFRPCKDTTTSTCQRTGDWSQVSLICQQYRWNHVTAPFYESFPCGRGDMWSVHVHGNQTSEGEIDVALKRDTDDLLHVLSFCTAKSGLNLLKEITIMTKNNGSYGDPITIKGCRLTIGKMFNMTISFSNTMYTVFLDGQVIGGLTVRLQDSKPKTLEIKNKIHFNRVEISQ